MKTKAAEARRHLDRRFDGMQPAREHMAVPVRGWIRAIRDGLGMTAAQLARRMGVAQPTLTTMEASEARGTIQLATLRRVAEAMDCTLVYALVPNASLDHIIQERARKVAREQLQPVEHSMLLEDQALTPEDRERELAAFIRELDPRSLWERP